MQLGTRTRARKSNGHSLSYAAIRSHRQWLTPACSSSPSLADAIPLVLFTIDASTRIFPFHSRRSRRIVARLSLSLPPAARTVVLAE